jgi:hypothetical protein
VVDEKVYVADPFASARDDVAVVPSTMMVKVPVGVAVLEADAEATVIVMTSFAPGAGVAFAATSVVLEAANFEDPGHAESKLKKSIEPNPDASS